jgi:hypothetical protein
MSSHISVNILSDHRSNELLGFPILEMGYHERCILLNSTKNEDIVRLSPDLSGFRTSYRNWYFLTNASASPQFNSSSSTPHQHASPDRHSCEKCPRLSILSRLISVSHPGRFTSFPSFAFPRPSSNNKPARRRTCLRGPL